MQGGVLTQPTLGVWEMDAIKTVRGHLLIATVIVAAIAFVAFALLKEVEHVPHYDSLGLVIKILGS